MAFKKAEMYFRIWENYNNLPLDGGSDFLSLWMWNFSYEKLKMLA